MQTQPRTQKEKFIGKALIVWGLATLFYFYDNLLQVSLSGMKNELFYDFVSNAEEYGSLSAYFLWTYGIMQIPVGLLMDKYGPRILLTVACMLAALGSLLFGYAPMLLVAKLGRALMGLGAAFAVVGCLKVTSAWFIPKRFALMTGLMVTVGFFGSISSLSFISYVVDIFGWRGSMIWGGVFGGLLTLLLWFIVRDKPAVEALPHAAGYEKIGLWQGLQEVIKNPQSWIAAIYAGLMFIPTLGFGGLWGLPFFEEAHGFAKEEAGKIVSLIYMGWIFGAPMFGWISDHLGKRNLPMYIATFMTIGLCITVIYVPDLPLWLLGTVLFGLGFFSSGFILAFAVIRELNRRLVTGTAIGFMNALNTFGGAAAQPFIGKLLDWQASSKIETPVAVFTLEQYQDAFLFIPGCLIVALVLVFFIKETHCQPKTN